MAKKKKEQPSQDMSPLEAFDKMMMKKSFLFIIVAIFGLLGTVKAQCIPNPIYADSSFGIWPDTIENLPCGNPHVLYETVMEFKNGSIASDIDPLFDPWPINWVRLDSVGGLPSGIAVQTDNPQWLADEQGCATLTGLANAGNYDLTLYFTWQISVAGFPLEQQLSYGGYHLEIYTGCGCNLSLTVNSVAETGVGFNDGTASVTASGGTNPYTYLWSNGQATSSVSGLSPGSYTVTVNDSVGCDSTASAIVQPACTLAGSITSTNASAQGANDGSATVIVSGGAAPLTYLWNNGSPVANIAGLSSGLVYSVIVTDADGCTYNGSTAVNVSGCTLSIAISGTNVTQAGLSDGTANVVITDGNPPYVITWSNGESTTSISGLPVGLYQVEVEDQANCKEAGTVTINSGQIVGEYQVPNSGFQVIVFPNPFSEETTIQYELPYSGEIDFMVSDLLGKTVYEEVLTGVKGENKLVFVKDGLYPGIYLYQLKHKDQAVTGKIIISGQ